jgi:hypothetical protein
MKRYDNENFENDLSSYRAVEIDRRIKSAYYLHHQRDEQTTKNFYARGLLIVLTTEAVSTSEMSVNFYQNTRRNIPEDSRLHTRR